MGERLSGTGIATVYTSDLQRARDTARAISSATGAPLVETAALRELDEGEWEGLTEELIERSWPDLWRDRMTSRRPGGETPDEALARALDFVKQAASAHPDGTVVAVTHQTMIRMLYGTAVGAQREKTADPRWPANGEIVIVDAVGETLIASPEAF